MNVNHIEGGIFMNYNKPELETLELEMVDVITVSADKGNEDSITTLPDW